MKFQADKYLFWFGLFGSLCGSLIGDQQTGPIYALVGCILGIALTFALKYYLR